MIRKENADLKGQKSMEDVVNKLSLLHPEYTEELKMLLDAYKMPFAHFCADEADFRLKEYYEVDDTAESYQELADKIAGELFASEYYLDCDTADQIIEEALKEYSVTVSKMDDICYFVEGKNVLFNANKSDYEVMARILCKIHHQDSLLLYDMILVMLKKDRNRIISYKELEKIYQDCLKKCQIECQKVSETQNSKKGKCSNVQEKTFLDIIQESDNMEDVLNQILLSRLREDHAEPIEYLRVLLKDDKEI